MTIETIDHCDRNAVIQQIKSNLERRSGKKWSVTGGRGTSWGWIDITAPPARRTWSHRLKPGATSDNPEDWEPFDSGERGHEMSPADRGELVALLGFDNDGRHVGAQGVSIAASSDYRREYLKRAAGQKPDKIAQPYWD